MVVWHDTNRQSPGQMLGWEAIAGGRKSENPRRKCDGLLLLGWKSLAGSLQTGFAPSGTLQWLRTTVLKIQRWLKLCIDELKNLDCSMDRAGIFGGCYQLFFFPSVVLSRKSSSLWDRLTGYISVPRCNHLHTVLLYCLTRIDPRMDQNVRVSSELCLFLPERGRRNDACVRHG